jgi:hypothetical protein
MYHITSEIDHNEMDLHMIARWIGWLSAELTRLANGQSCFINHNADQNFSFLFPLPLLGKRNMPAFILIINNSLD